jgi:hypothetical protein
MEAKPQLDWRADEAASDAIRRRGLLLGLVGGLVATIVIDVITVAVMPLMGAPRDGGFSIIGDTAAGFLALLGIGVAGGVPLGALLHYLIGLALGALFGVAVTRIHALRLSSIKKGLGLGFLYTEIISLPILVTPPIILKWTADTAVQWFGFSFVMHAIWGMTLGLIVSWGLRSASGPRQE